MKITVPSVTILAALLSMVVSDAVPEAAAGQASTFQAKAWESPVGKSFFPEQDEFRYPEINLKPNTGISFEGGGSKTTSLTLGVLGALHELDLIHRVRYLSGISGGGFAVTLYSYNNLTDVSDEVLLGKIIKPEDITLENLEAMDPNCARSTVTVFWNTDLSHLNGPIFGQFEAGVQSRFLDPMGIPRGAPFSYNAETVEHIKNANPSLADVKFITLKEGNRHLGIDSRPFPIIGLALVGPAIDLPINQFNRNFTLVEVTPLSAGVAFDSIIDYNGIPLDVGGLIEPFAFTLRVNNSAGLASGSPHGVVSVGDSAAISTLMDLTFMMSTAGFGLGADLAASPITANAIFLDEFPYWSPTTAAVHSSVTTVLTDGGNFVNDNIISLIQRGVTRIVACDFPKIGLNATWVPQPNSNGFVINFSETDIDLNLASLFGQNPIEFQLEESGRSNDPTIITEVNGVEINKNQVFPATDFTPLVLQLQEALATGNGIVTKTSHITIANPYFGIPAGLEIKILWLYASPAPEWERKLSDDVQPLLTVPSYIPLQQRFPNWPEFATNLTSSQSNLLANFGGWLVHHHRHVFSEFLEY